MRLALFFLLLWNTASTTFSFHLRRRVDEQDPAMMHMVDRTQGGTMPPNASPGDVVPPHTDDFATDDAAVTDDDELEKIEEGKSDVDVTLELEPNPEVPTTESFNQQFDDDDQNQNDDDQNQNDDDQNQNDDANNIGPTDDAIDKNDDDNFADGSGNSPEKVRIDDDSFGDEQKSQVDVGDIRDQYQSDEDKKVRELGGLGILFGLLAMIFTAWQMSENPDGLYAALCRLILTILGLMVSIIARPCKRHRHDGHMPVSTMEYGYRDPSLEMS